LSNLPAEEFQLGCRVTACAAVILEEERKIMIKNFAQQLRAVIKDKKGLESLEYAVFAVAFLVIINGVVIALSSTLSTAYSDIGSWITTTAGAM